jgi:hypothetical protein
MDISGASYFDEEEDLDDIPLKQEVAKDGKSASRKIVNQVAVESDQQVFEFPGVTNTRSK